MQSHVAGKLDSEDVSSLLVASRRVWTLAITTSLMMGAPWNDCEFLRPIPGPWRAAKLFAVPAKWNGSKTKQGHSTVFEDSSAGCRRACFHRCFMYQRGSCRWGVLPAGFASRSWSVYSSTWCSSWPSPCSACSGAKSSRDSWIRSILFFVFFFVFFTSFPQRWFIHHLNPSKSSREASY